MVNKNLYECTVRLTTDHHNRPALGFLAVWPVLQPVITLARNGPAAPKVHQRPLFQPRPSAIYLSHRKQGKPRKIGTIQMHAPSTAYIAKMLQKYPISYVSFADTSDPVSRLGQRNLPRHVPQTGRLLWLLNFLQSDMS